jgi:hypothetical protein
MNTVACIIASEYSTDRFAWSGSTATFVAESSELGWRPGSFARHIWLVSARTGERRLAHITGADRTPAGDVAGWRYTVSVREGERPCSILVIND